MITKKGMIVFIMIAIGLIVLSGLMSCKKEVEVLDQSKILGTWYLETNTDYKFIYTEDSIKVEASTFSVSHYYEWVSDSTFFCNNASFKVLSVTDNSMVMLEGGDTIRHFR